MNTMPFKSSKAVLGFVAIMVAAAIGVYALFDGDNTVIAVDPSNIELVALGERIYRKACAVCHGANLEGQPNWRSRKADGTLPAPPHDKTGHTWHHPDQELFSYTKFGGAALAPPGFKSAMPGFKDTLRDHDIWAVLSFITSRWPELERQHQIRINKRSKN